MLQPTTGKSALASKLQEWGNSKLVTFKDFDSMMQGIDKDFILEDNVLLRRHTRAIVAGDTDRMFAQLTKAHVNDRSFGAHKSSFVPRSTNETEQQDILKAIRHYKLYEEHKSFIKRNFIVDQGKLRKLDTTTGYMSFDSYDPDQVIAHVTQQPIDADYKEFSIRAEKSQHYKRAQELSLGEGDKVTKRLFDKLVESNVDKFTEVKHDFMKQAEDLKAKALSFRGVLSEKDLTLAELNQVGALVNTWVTKLNTL